MKVQVWDHEDDWSPDRFHGVGQSLDDTTFYSWKRTPKGILLDTSTAEFRTKGEPTTLRKIVDKFGDAIDHYARVADVPNRLLAAVIAAESKGVTTAERMEPAINDASFGLTQMLTATAASLAKTAPAYMNLSALKGATPMPRGGDVATWRAILHHPVTAIQLGAWGLRVINDNEKAQFDPVFVYAAYNAGSVRPNANTPWGIHYYRRVENGVVKADAMLSFVKWYGDACAVYEAIS